MLQSRRSLLMFFGCAGALVAQTLVPPMLSAQRSTPQPIPSPHAPDPHFPPGLNGPDIGPDVGERRANPGDEKKIREDVQELYQLASEMKAQVDKTNSELVVSVTFVKKAQRAEKLAKKIKNLSK